MITATITRTTLGSTKKETGTIDDHHKVIHFNHAGASPSSDSVLQRMTSHLQAEQRLGGYAAKGQVEEELTAVYEKAAQLIHATSANEIALTDSATTAWTRLFYAMAAYQHNKRVRPHNCQKIILVSEAEYAANLVAVC